MTSTRANPDDLGSRAHSGDQEVEKDAEATNPQQDRWLVDADS